MSAKIHRSAHFAGGSKRASTTSGTPDSSYHQRQSGMAVILLRLVLCCLVISVLHSGWVKDCTGVSSGPRERISRGTGVYGAGPGTEGDRGCVCTADP